METVRMTAITFPIRFWGVSVWIKDIICTENMVENTMTAKQHRVRTAYVAIAEEDSSAAPMGNTLTAQAVMRLPALRTSSRLAKIPAPIPPASPPAASAPWAKP